MRIQIFCERDRPPYVSANVRWEETGIVVPVDFVVDTGAFDMTISEEDAMRLGASIADLGAPASPITGIGGTVRSFVMRGVSIAFAGEDAYGKGVELDSVRVMEGPRTGTRRRRTGFVPSILGRRFMELNGFLLHWDFGRRIARFDVPDRTPRHDCDRSRVNHQRSSRS